MGHNACSLIVLLTESLDGIGTFQGVDSLGIVHQERLVKVNEIIIDVLSHLLVLIIQTELLALHQTVAK